MSASEKRFIFPEVSDSCGFRAEVFQSQLSEKAWNTSVFLRFKRPAAISENRDVFSIFGGTGDA